MITEFNTLPKKIYYVQTAEACTVMDPDGEPLAEITAPGGYFPGIGSADASTGTVTFSPAVKRVIGPFDLAPQLQLTLLGLLGGNGGLPSGYTRLGYLESPSTVAQNVPAFFAVPVDSTPGLDSLRIVSKHFLPETNESSKLQIEGVGRNLSTFTTFAWSATSKSFFISFDGLVEGDYSPERDINVYFTTSSGEWIVYESERSMNGFVLKINGEKKAEYIVNKWRGVNCLKIGCFGRVAGDNTYSNYGFFGRKKWWKLYKDNVLQNHLVPCLDEVGSPCMYDLVTSQPFYNKGSGAFIAGLETQNQFNNMLSKLPDRTGQEVGTLQVRLAAELQTPENESKLESMLAKNWEISQAA